MNSSNYLVLFRIIVIICFSYFIVWFLNIVSIFLSIWALPFCLTLLCPFDFVIIIIIIIIPLAVEALGFWGQEALSTIKSLGQLQSLCLGFDHKETVKHLFQTVALWQGNSHLWVSMQVPTTSPMVNYPSLLFFPFSLFLSRLFLVSFL